MHLAPKRKKNIEGQIEKIQKEITFSQYRSAKCQCTWLFKKALTNKYAFDILTKHLAPYELEPVIFDDVVTISYNVWALIMMGRPENHKTVKGIKFFLQYIQSFKSGKFKNKKIILTGSSKLIIDKSGKCVVSREFHNSGDCNRYYRKEYKSLEDAILLKKVDEK